MEIDSAYNVGNLTLKRKASAAVRMYIDKTCADKIAACVIFLIKGKLSVI